MTIIEHDKDKVPQIEILVMCNCAPPSLLDKKNYYPHYLSWFYWHQFFVCFFLNKLLS